MKTWNRYDLVADPNDADIVFAVRFVDPPNTVPQIRIGVADAKTHITLWGFVEWPARSNRQTQSQSSSHDRSRTA